MANNIMFNPDGSYSFGKGKPLSQGIKIDPSKLQQYEVNGASPWTKSANQKVGGSYPSGFMNDGVRSPMGSGFTMVPEVTGVPATIESPISVESMPRTSGNLPPKIGSPYVEASFKNGNGGLQDVKGMALQTLIASLVPNVTQASELEDQGIKSSMRKDGYNPDNKQMDYSKNPVTDITNDVFSEIKKPVQQPPTMAQKLATTQAQSNSQMAAPEDPGTEMSYKHSSKGFNPNLGMPVSTSGLEGMINNYAKSGQNMANGRDDELMRLMGMRDQVEGSIANKTTFDRMDLSPLSRFVDSMTGSKLSEGYKTPDSGMQDINNVNAVNEKISNYTKNKNAEQLALYKTLLDSQAKDDKNNLTQQLGFAKLENTMLKQNDGSGKLIAQDAKELSKLVNDPSTRKLAGQYQGTIDGTDKIMAFINEMYPPQPGETHDQAIARLNKITNSQMAEIVTAFDRSLKGNVGASTVSSFEHLAPNTLKGKAGKVWENLTGNPTPANQGQHVANMIESLKAEKDLNRAKLDEQQQRLGRGFDRLKSNNPDQFYGIFGTDIKGNRLREEKGPHLGNEGQSASFGINTDAIDAEIKRRLGAK